jgi:hypothetical protein
MIYTASYFKPTHHHGRRISLSRTMPKGVQVEGALPFFAPQAALINGWKKGHLVEHQYIGQYRADLKPVWPQIQVWLRTLDPCLDQTLLCWEPPGQFCHRNLVYALVKKFRPDCCGGKDLP